MPIAVKMPKLGMTMTEADLVGWLVREGEDVQKEQAVAEVETDKIVNEVVAPADGTLARIVVQEGAEEVSVGATLGWILFAGEDESDIPDAG